MKYTHLLFYKLKGWGKGRRIDVTVVDNEGAMAVRRTSYVDKVTGTLTVEEFFVVPGNRGNLGGVGREVEGQGVSFPTTSPLWSRRKVRLSVQKHGSLDQRCLWGLKERSPLTDVPEEGRVLIVSRPE